MSKILYAYAIPTYGTVDISWAQSYKQIGQPLGSSTGEIIDATDRDIAVKRNELVRRCKEMKAENIFFIGDDVLPPANTAIQFLMRRRQGARVITGVYWSKSYPSVPLIWQEYLGGPYFDWHVGDYFKIAWAGCDCLMIDMKVFDEIEPPWFSLDYNFHTQPDPSQRSTVNNIGTEDVYFYTKLKQAGIDVWCDAGIQCKHVDRNTKTMFHLPFDWPQNRPGSQIPRKNGLLVADIGCGYRQIPLQMEGDVVRFDINPVCQPNVLCDVRHIPDMDDKYDRVYASHVLEHLPLADAVDTVREWTRILKPDGILNIMVPNIQLACEQVAKGQWTGYHHLMIYGGQRGPEDFHFNGFTPLTMRQLIAEVDNLELLDLKLNPLPNPEAEIEVVAKKTKSLTVPALSEAWEDNSEGSKNEAA